MPFQLSIDQVLRLRVRAQRLFDPPEARLQPAALARAVCGIQAQDLPAAVLAFRPRSGADSADEVDQARQEGRLVRTWGMRGTLHLLAAEDALWLVPFLGPIYIPNHRWRLDQLGWDPERLAAGLRLLEDALGSRGSLTRREIIRLLRDQGLPSQGQAPIHLIYHAAFAGILIQGPDQGKEACFVHFKNWAGQMKPLPPDQGLARLASRYMEGYGPVGVRDFANWSGLKVSAAREAWKRIAGLVEPVEIPELPGEEMVILKTQLHWLEEAPDPTAVRLLPRFDNYLLGYADRRLIVEPAFADRLTPGGGIISPVVLAADGRVIASVKAEIHRAGLAVTIFPFKPLDPAFLPALEAEAADLGRYIGVTVRLVVATPSPPRNAARQP